MLNFDFHCPTRIVFGKDSPHQIGELLKPYSKKVLIHYGSDRIIKSGLLNIVTSSLTSNGIEFVKLGGVVPNPRLSLVHEGIALCKKEGVDLILAIGGGSVIDSSKAIAMGVFYDGDIWEVFKHSTPITKALPVATILTIPAAGSESSINTVITNEEEQRKLGYGSPHLRPMISIINPELFYTLPKDQIANGVADMMSHIFERYFTRTDHTELVDRLCESTLKAIMHNALLVIEDPSDYNTWCQIGFAGTLAHNNLLGMGREQDWACHGMEHELTALYDIPHGTGLAVLTPGWMRYVYKEHLDIFIQFAVYVMGVELYHRDPEKTILEAIAKLREFYTRIGLPTSLQQLGIDDSNFELMAKKATRVYYGPERPLGNFKKLYWQDVLEIYRLVKE
jgi:alcohol dehydrogenase YqhD (iron-dependent ADH family)